MSIRIGTNMAECATELPEFAKESLGLGQIWTRIIAELRKHDFQGGLYGCAGAVFWPNWLIHLYSAMYLDGLWELFGAFWSDSALFVLFGFIWLDDSGRSSPYDTNKPESA